MKIREVVQDALVALILFVDLQDSAVLRVGRRKNPRRLSAQENRGVGSMAINKAANDDHDDNPAPKTRVTKTRARPRLQT